MMGSGLKKRTGSYVSGAIGAFAGALLGAVIWALCLILDYKAGIIALAVLIGWLIRKGYELLRGNVGRGKGMILMSAVILSVTVGTIGAHVTMLAQMIGTGELPGLAYGDIPMAMVAMLNEDPEFVSAVFHEVLVGLVFGGLGALIIPECDEEKSQEQN